MYDVTFFGNPPVDVLTPVTPQLLREFKLTPGDWQSVSEATLKAVLAQTNEAEHRRIPGGSAGNTAFSMAQLGGQVAFCGRVGDDEAGQLYFNTMQDAGINMPAPREGGTTLLIHCLLTPDGERTFITNGVHTPALDDEVVSEHVIAQSQWIFIEGYLFGETFEYILKACRIARKNGVKIALTLAAPFVVSSQFDKIALLIRDGVDLIIANDEELRTLLSTELSADDAQHSAATLEAISATPRVITHGAKGAEFHANGEAVHVPAIPVTDVLDTTGAGDGFAAGFMYGYVRNMGAERALQLGHLVASKVVGVIGARLSTEYAEIRQKFAIDNAG